MPYLTVRDQLTCPTETNTRTILPFPLHGSFSNEAFMEKVTPINLFKIRASYGLSGWDGNLSHELWRQSYGSGGAGYNFGVNAGGQSGGSEAICRLSAW